MKKLRANKTKRKNPNSEVKAKGIVPEQKKDGFQKFQDYPVKIIGFIGTVVGLIIGIIALIKYSNSQPHYNFTSTGVFENTVYKNGQGYFEFLFFGYAYNTGEKPLFAQSISLKLTYKNQTYYFKPLKQDTSHYVIMPGAIFYRDKNKDIDLQLQKTLQPDNQYYGSFVFRIDSTEETNEILFGSGAKERKFSIVCTDRDGTVFESELNNSGVVKPIEDSRGVKYYDKNGLTIYDTNVFTNIDSLLSALDSITFKDAIDAIKDFRSGKKKVPSN